MSPDGFLLAPVGGTEQQLIRAHLTDEGIEQEVVETANFVPMVPGLQKMKFELSVFLKGFAMGTADLVPGVSGGTIALITGIYDRLITAIASIDQHAISMLFKGEILDAWRRVDAGFLVTLASGMFAAIVLLASSIDWMLTTFPLPLWSFFLV